MLEQLQLSVANFQQAQSTQSTMEETIQDLTSRLALAESGQAGSKSLQTRVEKLEKEKSRMVGEMETLATVTKKATMMEFKNAFDKEKADLAVSLSSLEILLNA